VRVRVHYARARAHCELRCGSPPALSVLKTFSVWSDAASPPQNGLVLRLPYSFCRFVRYGWFFRL
jgi:hypothetical protein